MRWLKLALVLLLGTAVSAGAKPLNKLVGALETAQAGSQVPAMGVVVIRGGRVVGSAVRGARRRDSAAQVRLTDSWIIGSTAKVQTVAMIARLAERGVLSWDAPLSQLLPDLAATVRPEYRSVTLVQLLSHHAGLPENVSDMAFFESFFHDHRALGVQRQVYITRALKEPAIYPAGRDYGYSNTGFLVAAVIAERATGRSYEQLMRREVFGPLGMASAGFGATGPDQPSGHNGGKPVPPSNPDMFAPAGNLHMSLRDWSRFCVDQLQGAKGHGRLLSQASYRLMQSAQPGGGNGVDWGIQPAIAGRKGPVLVHGGSDGNWFAYMVLFPETGNGVLVIDNASADMGGDSAVMTLLGAMLPTLASPKEP